MTSPLVSALPNAAAVAQLFQRIAGLRVLVVGDLMLDRYMWGRVNRISPEAPVPIVDVQTEEYRLGGAANVGMNLHTLGATAVLCGMVGPDRDGELFRDVLQRTGLTAEGIIDVPGRRTTAKIRIIGHNQQMLRVDREDTAPLDAAQSALLQTRILDLLAGGSFDALIFEDYDKGLLSPALIQAVTTAAQAKGIPVTVDPKFKNFFAYSGSTVFKPNVKELNEALGSHTGRGDVAGLQANIQALRQRMPHSQTLVTLSEHGVLVCDNDGQFTHLPAHIRSIVDVSGAGDTVIATLTACIAAGLPVVPAAAIANLAGGLVCEHVGVVPIEAAALQNEIQLTINS